jgi:hypothetical protein
MGDGRSRTNSMINSESNKVIGHLNLDAPSMDKETYDQVSYQYKLTQLVHEIQERHHLRQEAKF